MSRCDKVRCKACGWRGDRRFSLGSDVHAARTGYGVCPKCGGGLGKTDLREEAKRARARAELQTLPEQPA